MTRGRIVEDCLPDRSNGVWWIRQCVENTWSRGRRNVKVVFPQA